MFRVTSLLAIWVPLAIFVPASEATVNALLDRVKQSTASWVMALDRIDQSWEPRAVPVPGPRR